MSEQNIIPSAPPLYPKLNGGDYRLKKIIDSQKELENEITHYRRISKKYKRAKTIINAFAVTTGALTTVLSTASLAALLSAIGRHFCSYGHNIHCHWCQQRKTEQ